MYISAMLSPGFDKVYVWERTGKRRKRVEYPLELYFFIQHPDGEYKDIYGNRLTKMEFDNFRDFSTAKKAYKAQGIQMYESDITVDQKVLTKYYLNKPVKELNITFFDIEIDYDKTRGFFGAKDAYAPVSAIALYHTHTKERIILALPPQHSPFEPSEKEWTLDDISENVTSQAQVIFCKSERELLSLFLDHIEDSDVISGWNSDGFDVPYLYKRILNVLGKRSLARMSFRDAKPPTIRTVEREVAPNFKVEEENVTLYGRVSIDYQALYKKFTQENRASYALAYIAEEEKLDLAKLQYEGSLYDLYRNDFSYYLEYNMIDTEIMVELEKKLSYFQLTLDLTHMATGQLTSVYGTIKLAELAIINKCHRDGSRVPDSRQHDYSGKYGGAFVLECVRGEHEWIGSIDVESLYPTSIICANVSPETIIGQFTRHDKDYDAIYHATDEYLTLEYENGMEETKSTEEWRAYFKERNYAMSGYGTVFDQNIKGFIPAILEEWFKERRNYKGHLAKYKKELETLTPEDDRYEKVKAKKEHYDRFQYIKKIQLNSLYGCMGNKFFKFFDVRLAESTTKTGREILIHMARKIGEEFKDGYRYPNKMVVYGDSVGAESLIYTDQGEFLIESLFDVVHDKRGEKEYHIPENLKVLTYDEDNNQSCYKKVNYIMRHKANKKMYRVWTTNSTFVDVTEDHSLMGYVNTQKRKKNESMMTEVTPESLGVDVKNIMFLKRIPREKIESKNYPREVYELMGLVLGDGGVHQKNSGVELSTGSFDREEIIQKVINPLIEKKFCTSVVRKGNGHDLRICGVKIFKILKDHLYEDDTKKIVPKFLFSEKEENIKAFLRGYFSADGTISGNTIRLTSVTPDHIKDTQKLLFLCGISSNYFTENSENNYNGVYSGTYSTHLVVKSINEFIRSVGFIQDRKSNKLPVPGKKSNYFDRLDIEISKFVKIEEIEYNDYVYDIEVEDTHTFFANNILVHNTDSCYFKTNARNLKEAKLICDYIEKTINKSFGPFMQKYFFSDEEVAKRVRVENEIISDIGIFVKKKIYLLHILFKDGYGCSEMKIMGHAIKKTGLPPSTKEALKSALEEYFVTKDWTQFLKRVVEFKEYVQTTDDIKEYGIPKKVNMVEKYQADYDDDPTCRISGGQAAAICWNICLREYGDTESLPITSGTPVRIYNLTKKLGRFHTIAIPSDLIMIPEWFTENIVPLIDREAQVEKLVDLTLTNICDAIGKQIPTEKAVMAEELLVY